MNHYNAKCLLTKFYYKNDNLHFQILIQNGDEIEIHGEYLDYDEYKEVFDALQSKMNEKKPLKAAPQKIKRAESFFAKMA